jgi:hypothetical protein
LPSRLIVNCHCFGSSAQSISPIQQELIRQRAAQEEEARQLAAREEEARRQELADITRREAVLQRKKTEAALALQNAEFAQSSDADTLMAENRAARAELEKRRSELFQQERAVEEQRRQIQAERLKREEARKRTELENEAIRKEQALLAAKEEELAEKWRRAEAEQMKLARAIADTKAENERLAEKEKLKEKAKLRAEQQKKDEEKQREQQKELQASFYSSLVDAAKLVAQNCGRVFNLLDTQFDDIMVDGSGSRSFFQDVTKLLDRTTVRLINLLDDNVLNIQDDLHNSIASAARGMPFKCSSTTQEKYLVPLLQISGHPCRPSWLYR